MRHIFLKWWLLEICLKQDKKLECITSAHEIFIKIVDYCEQLSSLLQVFATFQCTGHVFDELKGLTSQLHTCLNLPCNLCQNYGEIKTARDQIIELFGDIFRYQIWNIKTGRPVIEEMFCSRLKPFFYLWHIFPSIKTGDSMHFDTGKTTVTAIVNFAALITLSSFPEISENMLRHMCGLELSYNPDDALSQDGKFVAQKYGNHDINLLEVKNYSAFHSFNNDTVFRDIKHHCFTNDGNFFLYIQYKPNLNLFAFSLQTGKTLQSISGLCPVVCTSKEDKYFGYIFCNANERIMISLSDLSGDFFLRCLNCDTSKFGLPVEATFTSTDTIKFLFSSGMFKSWKIGDVLALNSKELQPHYSQNILIKKCAFSYNGKLIAINHIYDILLFNCEGKLVSSVFKITEQNKHTVYFLTFSSDASLLLFCIKESNDKQSFYIWDVQKEILSKRINLLFEMPIDCACFSQDNSKIFFCAAPAILIYNYPSKNCPNRTIAIPGKAFLKCSHCVVSPDNKLLVCCIGSEILVHQLDGRNAVWEVPHNHSGLIKSCTFLKGSRYLISYDMEGVILLFDLSEWKSVAYARLQESISTITVSHDEDKVVCLGSSGKAGFIKLHWLKCGLPSNFQMPSAFRLVSKNREQQVRQGISPPMPEIDFEMEDILDENAQLSPYSSESSESNDEK